MKLPSKVHVIGICGVATSALATAFHKRGVKVTGSDKGFFPPVSTELEKQGISFYAGWHPEKMFGGQIDADSIVIVGTASGSKNPETEFAREKNLPVYSFAEAIGKFFVRENSIVCAGTWGKTSSAALLSHILNESGFEPSYMFGGVSLSHETSAALTNSKWSVFEGDEYKSSPTDLKAKFFYYKPTHLLLTAVSWDHADLYPTEIDYFEAFKKLIEGLPDGAPATYCEDNLGIKNLELDPKRLKLIPYGSKNYSDIKQTSSGLEFNIGEHHIKSPLIGNFQVENITGCFTMAQVIGIPTEKIISAIGTFKGLKRRLEKRYEGDVTVFDDIAHSPEKAASVLASIKEIYKGQIIAVFEPNIGGRERESAYKYDHAFKDADAVIIPRLTKLKVGNPDIEQPMEGQELANTISKTHKNTLHIEDDAKLVEHLKASSKKGDVIIFLGSHGFRGMIEATTNN